MNTRDSRMGFSFLQSSISYFSVVIVAYNTLCYHEMTRPVSRIYERPPFRGSDLIQTDSPGTPPTYRFIINYHYHYIYAYKISGCPTSPVKGEGEVGHTRLQIFLGVDKNDMCKKFRRYHESVEQIWIRSLH